MQNSHACMLWMISVSCFWTGTRKSHPSPSPLIPLIVRDLWFHFVYNEPHLDKSGFGALLPCYHARFKPASSTTEASKSLGISDIVPAGIIPSQQWKRNALFSDCVHICQQVVFKWLCSARKCSLILLAAWSTMIVNLLRERNHRCHLFTA